MTIDLLVDSGNLVSSDTELKKLLNQIKQEDVYAIDTEFIGEGKEYPKLALIQLAWGDENTALVDPLEIDPRLFADFFEGAGLAILHSSVQDLQILKRFCDTVPHEIFDIQVAAGFVGQGHPNLANLLEETLDISLPKKAQLTDWLKRPLSKQQITYAQADVAHLIKIYEHLSVELKLRDRLDWAIEECELIRQKSESVDKLEDIWKSIKNIKRLNGKALGRAIELNHWRINRSKDLNITSQNLLNDTTLILLAEASPKTKKELKSLRILNRCFNKRSHTIREKLIDEVLDLTANAKSVELNDHFEVNQITAKNQRALFTLILAWVNSYALEIDLHPMLLATRNDILDFFSTPPQGRLIETWRTNILQKPLLRIAEGAAAIAIDDDGKLVLEERSKKSLSI